MSSLLRFDHVHAFYGAAHILHGVSFDIQSGERVALIGRNGVGKTTVVNSLLGIAQVTSGSIHIAEHQLVKQRAYMAAMHGVAVVPQGRHIVANLTIEENLRLGEATRRQGHWNLESVYQLFPILKERAHTPGTALSGGQQQMLAVGRALMSNPRLLILDEPTEGLAPVIVDQLGDILLNVAEQGCALLLIEQNLRLVVRVAQRFMAMTKGDVVVQGPVTPTEDSIKLLEQYITV